MTSIDRPYSDAEQTLAQLGMSSEPPTSESLGCRMAVGRDHDLGREGYLDSDFFKLRFLDLAHYPERDGNRAKAAMAERALRECEAGFGDVLLRGWMEQHLGGYGLRAAAMMLRLVEHSVLANQATEIATKLHIDPDASQTTLGVWDNGLVYGSDKALERAYLRDDFFDLTDGTKKQGRRSGNAETWPTYAVWHTIARPVAGGSMTIGSGSRALDVRAGDLKDSIDFDVRDIAPVRGNGVIVRLPHQGRQTNA